MRFCKPTKKQQDGYRKWVKKLPKKVRAVAERFDIWTLYRLKSSGDRVMLQSFDGDGTLTVAVSGKFNLVIAERQVFGVPPDDLEECDLPAPDEKLGALMTTEEAVDNLDAMRVLVRPDLWVMTEDGTAVRKQ
jgi:hypothetical protein